MTEDKQGALNPNSGIKYFPLIAADASSFEQFEAERIALFKQIKRDQIMYKLANSFNAKSFIYQNNFYITPKLHKYFTTKHGFCSNFDESNSSYMKLPGKSFAILSFIGCARRIPLGAKTGGGDGNRTHVRISSSSKQPTSLVFEYTFINPRKHREK
jgi:hypothetical protein